MSRSDNQSSNSATLKRSLIEWGVIGAIAVLLYVTGLHTEVIGTLQRAMLWTGLFDADTSKIASTEGPHLNNRDYALILQTPDEEQLSLGDFNGDVLFVNIWASWCPPCIAEMPTIKTLYEAAGDHPNITFILLSMDENKQKAIDFMDGKEFAMPFYFPASPLPQKLRSQYLPTTYVISKSGQIVYQQEGIADYSSPNFAQWIRDLAER